MVINEIYAKLETTSNPVARLFYKSGETKTLFIGFKKGMTLAQHVTHLPAKIMVITGKVTYIQEVERITLHQYESYDIPANIVHEVYADEDSLCLLIQG